MRGWIKFGADNVDKIVIVELLQLIGNVKKRDVGRVIKVGTVTVDCAGLTAV